MKEEVRKLACEQGWRPQHLMETLEALAEDAFGAVFVFLELGSSLPTQARGPSDKTRQMPIRVRLRRK